MSPASRENNYDLLRIVAMFFIVTGHFWHGGKPIGRYEETVMACFTSVTVIGVNLFFMLSGYFSWQRKQISLSKIFSLWGITVFYSLAIAIILAIFGKIYLTRTDIFKSFLPFISQRYWFMSVYVFIYILSPYINQLLNNLDFRNFSNLILILLVTFSIFPTFLPNDWAFNPIFNNSAIWGIVMYSTGVYFKRFNHKINFSRQFIWLGYALITVMIIISKLWLSKCFEHFGIASAIPVKLSSYYSPLVFSAAIFFFGIFRNINIHYKWIGQYSIYMLGIYLIHDNNQIRSLLWSNWLKTPSIFESHWLPLYIIFCGILVFSICLCLEKTRSYLCMKILKITFKK